MKVTVEDIQEIHWNLGEGYPKSNLEHLKGDYPDSWAFLSGLKRAIQAGLPWEFMEGCFHNLQQGATMKSAVWDALYDWDM